MDGELRETEVDGVPVYWVPGERRMRGSLWFRAGVADEAMPRRGWLHLLEHLALHGRDSIRAPVNGSVSMLHTTFDVEGEPNAVAEFLRRLCTWLSEPDFADLEHERRVLRAESATRRPGQVDLHVLWRYGAQGPGVAAYDEYGLHTADPDRLRALAAQAFARGNAVLALTGPPPAGLRLPLNDGTRWLARPAVPCEQPLPAGFAGVSGGVAMSGALPRSMAGPSLARALRRALETGFRHGTGVGYSAWASYEPVDPGTAMLTAGMDILPEARPTVVGETMAVLRGLRDRGPDPTDLRDELDEEVRRLKAEPAETWMPYLAAREVLLGRKVRTRDDLIAEASATTVEDVRQAALTMWSNLLLSVDPEAAGDPQLTWLDGPKPAVGVQTGQQFKPIGWPVRKGRLTVCHNNARIETPAGEVSADFDQLAIVIAYPDGGRQLIRRDGYQVPIEPAQWKNGRQATLAVDAGTSPAVRVAMPAREPDTIPHSTVTWRMKAAYWLKRPELWILAGLVAVVVVALATSTEIGDILPRAIGVGIAGGLVIFFQRRKDTR
ncbi:hypothetical protein ACFV9C_03520 [Kribbella sp. NPDC059898]|uniref:hypothetical protein n=1 Tax=Kribbella sp. NPDC059898 TaxID=3346995 RepID=UPI00366615A5